MSEQYEVGEVIYAFHQGLIYEAKILDMDFRDGKQMHHIHYKGWKDKWNEWVDDTRILKFNEENAIKRDLLKKREKEKNSSLMSDSSSSSSSLLHGKEHKKRGRPAAGPKNMLLEEDSSSSSKIELTAVLRRLLLDDRDSIIRKNLVRLPRPCSVHTLLNRYKEESGLSHIAPESSAQSLRKNIVSDIEVLFEVCVGSRLLYRFERPQFEDIHFKISREGELNRLSQVYGLEHFIRFLSKIPEFLSSNTIDFDTRAALCSEIAEIIKFLSKVAPQIAGPQNYEDVSVDYLRRLDL